MTLQEIQRTYEQEASKIENYKELSKTELANGYCDEEEASWACKEAGDDAGVVYHESLRSAYYAALSLRYWYKLFQWIENSKSLMLQPSDFIEWLEWTFWDAFYYRMWRWEYKAVVKDGHFIEWKLDENGNKIPNPYYWRVDPNAPDKIIQRCSASARGYFYQYHNKDIRKGNVQTYSLDAMVDENGDCSLEYAGCVEQPEEYDGVRGLISELLHKNEGIEALIIDGIAYWDTYKQIKHEHEQSEIDEETGEEIDTSYTSYSTQFDARKLVKHLNNVNQDFMRYFCQNYDISQEQATSIFDKLQKMNNTKLYKAIEKTLIEIRSNKDYLEYLSK